VNNKDSGSKTTQPAAGQNISRQKKPVTFGAFLYGILRTSHILWMSAVMPLAIFYIHKAGVHLSGADAMIFYIAGCLWALLIVGVDQIGYPVRLLDAFIATAGMALGIGLSFYASTGNILFSAYTIFVSSLATQTVLFFAAAFWIVSNFFREFQEIRAKKDTGIMLFAILAYFAFFGFTAWYAVKFARPFIRYASGLGGNIAKITAWSAMIIQILAWGWQLLGSSVFAKQTGEKQEREKSYEGWIPLICIAMVLSVVVSLFMFMD